jgi:hypothetical protein
LAGEAMMVPATAASLAGRNVADEAAVELEQVEGEGAQYRQRGMARAEIVERQPDAVAP